MQPYYNPTRRNLEDDLNIPVNGRQPQFFLRKTTSIFFKLKIMQPKTNKSKNNNIFKNGRRPQFKKKGR
jgi:hypothetical protein